MYEKNLPNRAGLTQEFQNGTFIEWVKCQHSYMDGEKIECPCRKCKNKVFETMNEVNFDLFMRGFMPKYYNWISHGEERLQEYFEAVTADPLLEEQTPVSHVMQYTSTPCGDAAQMDWV
ncbi:UNVERIFIED_CONTAM: hypothetical protein Sindi_2683300 [Sesamum indicum]